MSKFLNELADEWHKITSNDDTANQYNEQIRDVLEQKINPDQSNIWFYEAAQKGWYCAYKPLSTKQYAMFLHSSKVDKLIDESYIQLLFGFYCHQLSSLEGTYRDSLTGLYNRKAFDHRLAALMMKCQHFARRNNFSNPSFFVMLDIDLFKNVNDSYGHVYGDEILTIIACLMADSFREYDLLFRYGGEEFAAVLMDLDDALCSQILHRFKDKVETHDFPKHNQVTVSIGYTRFDKNLSVNALIDQADRALYYCKQNGRNCLHHYETLVEQGLIKPHFSPE